jgi:hypothetical protein
MAKPLLLCLPRPLSCNVRLVAIPLAELGAQASLESKTEIYFSLSSRYVLPFLMFPTTFIEKFLFLVKLVERDAGSLLPDPRYPRKA